MDIVFVCHGQFFINTVLQPHAANVLHRVFHTRNHHLEADWEQVRATAAHQLEHVDFTHLPLRAVFFIRLCVCLTRREAINGGLTTLRRVIPGGDTFMNLGLEMVRLTLDFLLSWMNWFLVLQRWHLLLLLQANGQIYQERRGKLHHTPSTYTSRHLLTRLQRT